MLKDFIVTYVNDNGYTINERVMAFDRDQALSAFIYTHPNVNKSRLSCAAV